MRILKKISGWLIFIVFGVFLTLFIPSFFVFFVRLLYGFYDGCFTLNGDFCGAVSLVKSRVFDDLFRDFSGNMSSWFAALGTIAAVVVAIFKDSFVKWYKRPKLNVSIDDNKGDSPCYRNVPQFYAGRCDSICNSFFLRIRVRNRGLSVAENVQVFAKQINTYSCAGIEEKPVDYLAMDMVWANSGDDFFPRIYPDSERYCDIALILDPDIRGFDSRYYCHQQWSGKYEEKEPALCIQVRYPLGSGDHIKGPGRYGLHVVVSGKDVEPINKEIIIDTCDFKSWPDRDKDAKEEEKEIRGKVKFCVYQNWWHKNVRRVKELISKAPFKMQSCD
ncbi:hypothetical protein EST62_11800 [Chlorobaculum sp. 24CR]|uniref:hypothetical protein n=1 Tax=Chlorobaculum sp. 24CR TaxID=2508878 RepID=UPI00100C2375|nr:hypothetical protein [Chlorobaculum sp. 24CR]RXK81628.1 hypothetical protein EST62_11800 [Chlorobaculum sp. 24CR]